MTRALRKDRFRCFEFKRYAMLLILLVAPSTTIADWPYHGQWGNFRVHADLPLATVSPMFEDLLTLSREVQQRLHVGPSTEMIDVYLFAQRETYRQYMRYYFPTVGFREAMFVKSNSPGNVFAYAGQQLEVDLRHECTHAILHSMLPMVPWWLDEGLAVYFELPAAQRAFDNPYLASVRRQAMMRITPSLTRLESLEDLSQMGVREYREAWAWVHFLLHGPEAARRTLLEYFDDLAHHRPPTPISKRLQQAMPEAPRQMASHFRSWRR